MHANPNGERRKCTLRTPHDEDRKKPGVISARRARACICACANGRVHSVSGGVVSSVPVEGLTDRSGRTLVLLTRRFEVLPSVPGRIYVMPSGPIPANAWDYTDDAAVQSTFDLGRRDGERFCSALGA